MTIHKLNKAITKTWEITESGNWELGSKGKITGTNIDGIYAADTILKAYVRIDGVIELAGSSTGANLMADHTELTVGKYGRITTDGVAIAYENTVGAPTIRNDGILKADTGITILNEQDLGIVYNNGTINAISRGVSLETAGSAVLNNGMIKAQTAIHLGSQPDNTDQFDSYGASRVKNTGTLVGSEFAIVADNVAADIRNRGKIVGDIQLDLGSDNFNTVGGTFLGDIYGGEGADTFDMRNATFKGTIYGGLDDDTVTLSSAGTTFVENVGEGFDSVRSYINYTLGENIEHLFLFGSRDLNGKGNSLDNFITGNNYANTLHGLEGNDRMDGGFGRDTLRGGAGDDLLIGDNGRNVLYGGEGADTFVFGGGNEVTTIMDFANGIEQIDIEIYVITTFEQIAEHMKQSGDNVVISFGDLDRLIIRNIATGDIDASDFVL